MIITSIKDFNMAFFKLLQKNPLKVKIITYGLYAGILDSGKDINDRKQTGTQLLLKEIAFQKLPCEILVGIPEYLSCKGQERCEDCVIKYNKGIERLKKTSQLYPEIDWYFAERMHIKGYMFEYKEEPRITLMGSRNFTDSGYDEVIMKASTKDGEQLNNIFDNLKKDSLKVEDLDNLKMNREVKIEKIKKEE